MLSWQRRDIYFRLMRTDRPIGTYLVAWPALWALWFATDGPPPIRLVLVFVIGAFLMRSAGCVINDVADRRVDPDVSRTQGRPLATGELSVREALVLFVLLCTLAAILLLFLNTLTQLLALAGLGVLRILLLRATLARAGRSQRNHLDELLELARDAPALLRDGLEQLLEFLRGVLAARTLGATGTRRT